MDTFQSGVYRKQGSYSSFQPNLINRAWNLSDMQIIELLGQADREIGRLDMYSRYVPNIDLFVRMHVAKEATQSSKIEGTQTRLEEVLQKKEDLPLERRDDWEEVQNYIEAMHYSIGALGNLPFSNRLIKNTHQVLMKGVRGKHRQPGHFRTSQNWIGGATLRDAIFIPPHQSEVPALMGDLELFAHNEGHYFPPLLKTALIHYQFETIHPFLDGNGRTGRLLITLYLVSQSILKRPVLYVSDFFERNRSLYYDNLMRVRDQHDLAQWFKFFLVGMIETAQQGISTFDQILQLQKDVDQKLQSLKSRAGNAGKILSYLYQHPLIDAEKVKEVAHISLPAAYSLIRALEKLTILKEITGAARGRVYVFEEYLNLFRA